MSSSSIFIELLISYGRHLTCHLSYILRGFSTSRATLPSARSRRGPRITGRDPGLEALKACGVFQRCAFQQCAKVCLQTRLLLHQRLPREPRQVSGEQPGQVSTAGQRKRAELHWHARVWRAHLLLKIVWSALLKPIMGKFDDSKAPGSLRNDTNSPTSRNDSRPVY